MAQKCSNFCFNKLGKSSSSNLALENFNTLKLSEGMIEIYIIMAFTHGFNIMPLDEAYIKNFEKDH